MQADKCADLPPPLIARTPLTYDLHYLASSHLCLSTAVYWEGGTLNLDDSGGFATDNQRPARRHSQ